MAPGLLPLVPEAFLVVEGVPGAGSSILGILKTIAGSLGKLGGQDGASEASGFETLTLEEGPSVGFLESSSSFHLGDSSWALAWASM